MPGRLQVTCLLRLPIAIDLRALTTLGPAQFLLRRRIIVVPRIILRLAQLTLTWVLLTLTSNDDVIISGNLDPQVQ